MMKLRAAEARGKANFGWLDARHSFSFGHYYDPDWMGHSVLRVINQIWWRRVAVSRPTLTPIWKS